MLRFEGITKHYALGSREIAALNSVSGEIHRGEMVALCGPSGSGKSTLLNVLGLLEPHYQGVVTLDGQRYPQHARKAATLRRTQLGFVFQRFNLIPVMTAWENVAYPLQLNGCSEQVQRQRAQEMLCRVGLETVLHQRPDHLSGGQQQRVAIARALVHRPQLVIADEPTASLDSETAAQVVGLMKALSRETGTTFVVATHDARMARHCDRCLTLVDGSLVGEDLSWAS